MTNISSFKAEKDRAALRIWLAIVLVAIAALVIVGGATRMTDSGLSITQWKPIHGVIPPLNEAEWQEELDLYKAIPEYERINKGMTVAEFKFIYWWEWTHRLLARSVGVIFALPLLFFWLTGRIESRLKLPLLGILALGGLQGFVGWWMVASGLVDRVDVSQYRLATHLTLASIIFAAIVWVWRGIGHHSSDRPPSAASVRVAGLLVALVLLQIYLGGLVAGLHAGLVYNTWPMMDDRFVPLGLFVMKPWFINLFENATTVQFDHRMVAYLLWVLAGLHVIGNLRITPSSTHARRSIVLFGLVTIQALLGITTLVLQVPMGWALAHQTGAIVVLGFAVAHWRGFHGSYAMPEPVAPRVAVTV